MLWRAKHRVLAAGCAVCALGVSPAAAGARAGAGQLLVGDFSGDAGCGEYANEAWRAVPPDGGDAIDLGAAALDDNGSRVVDASGTHVAFLAHKAVHVVDLTRGRERRLAVPDAYARLTLSPRGGTLLVDDRAGDRPDLLLTAAGPLRLGHDIVVAPDGQAAVGIVGRQFALATAARRWRPQALPGGGLVSPSSWSPDGRTLMLVIGDPESTDTYAGLRTFDRDSRRYRDLVSPAYTGDPAWSPDGRWIAGLASLRAGTQSVVVYNPQTLVSHSVGEPISGSDASLRWRPGDELTVTDGDQHTQVLDLGGTVRWRQDLGPQSWSPAGRWLLAARSGRPGWALVAGATGTARPLHGVAGAGVPASIGWQEQEWLGDTAVAVSAGTGLYVAHPGDGSVRKVLAAGPGHHLAPLGVLHASPAGLRLVARLRAPVAKAGDC
jgi:hypothetical protein